MNKLRDSGIDEKLVRDSGSRPPLPDPVLTDFSFCVLPNVKLQHEIDSCWTAFEGKLSF